MMNKKDYKEFMQKYALYKKLIRNLRLKKDEKIKIKIIKSNINSDEKS